MEKTGYLSKSTFGYMLAVAIVFDLISLIPIVGNVVSPVAWLTFFLWFKSHGINLNSKDRLMTMGGGFLVEVIPVLGMLPAWTAVVVIMYIMTKAPKVVQMAANQSGQSPKV